MNPSPSKAPGEAEAWYASRTHIRDDYMRRARRCASLTIPHLFREDGANSTSDAEVPSQSFGAYCVNNLTSKLMLTMFPPGLPFIRLKPSKKALRDLEELEGTDRGALKTEIGKGLSMAEREFVDAVDADGDAGVHTKSIRNQIIGGNYAIAMDSQGKLRGIALGSYVVARDRSGNPLRWCIKDPLAYETVPEDVRAICDDEHPRAPNSTAPDTTKDIDVYTHGQLKEGKWHVFQEVYGRKVPNSEWTYAPDMLPYLFLAFNLLEGEDYGRGYVEDYEGDLQSIEGLDTIITEGSAASALLIRMVRPGGVTSKRSLQEAVNGSVITGDVNDVATLETGKHSDYRAAQETMNMKIERLSKAFLLNSAVQRGGERVTAEEIRFVAQELQDSLGGVYSSMVTTYQAPFARIKMAALQRHGRMTKLPKAAVDFTVTTGAAALGRNAELQGLDALAQSPSQSAPPPPLNWNLYYQRRATALGVDQEGLVLTEEEQSARMQADQMNQLGMQVAPEMVKQVGGMAQQAMAADQQQQQQP